MVSSELHAKSLLSAIDQAVNSNKIRTHVQDRMLLMQELHNFLASAGQPTHADVPHGPQSNASLASRDAFVQKLRQENAELREQLQAALGDLAVSRRCETQLYQRLEHKMEEMRRLMQAPPQDFSRRGSKSTDDGYGSLEALSYEEAPTPPEQSAIPNAEASANNEEQLDPEQFKIDLHKIASGMDQRTTCMIRNIPNKYSQRLLMSTIEEQVPNLSFDFLYVPVNVHNRRNVGYAFINFTEAHHIIPFYQHFHGSGWQKFNSDKICAITYARLQGLDMLLQHFRSGSCPERKVQPMFRLGNGPLQMDQEELHPQQPQAHRQPQSQQPQQVKQVSVQQQHNDYQTKNQFQHQQNPHSQLHYSLMQMDLQMQQQMQARMQSQQHHPQPLPNKQSQPRSQPRSQQQLQSNHLKMLQEQQQQQQQQQQRQHNSQHARLQMQFQQPQAETRKPLNRTMPQQPKRKQDKLSPQYIKMSDLAFFGPGELDHVRPPPGLDDVSTTSGDHSDTSAFP